MRSLIWRVRGRAGANGGFQSAIDLCHDSDGAPKCAATKAASGGQLKCQVKGTQLKLAATNSRTTAKQALGFDPVIADGAAHQFAEAGEIHFFHKDAAEDSGGNEDMGDLEAIGPDESYELRDGDGQDENPTAQITEDHDRYQDKGLCAPRPFCVVALRAKVDPGRSVAVLSNGLLAIRMGKAGLETPVPRVA